MPNNVYLFDVDGTLTVSRKVIDPEFKKFFLTFIDNNEVYLVTGSDYPKTVEQLGEEIMNNVVRSYQCSGNSLWEKGKEVSRNKWVLGDEERSFLLNELAMSKFPIRTGTHLEDRPGMANFTVLGRGATPEQREEYVKYNNEHKERERIADLFNSKFSVNGVKAQVAGETGLDIVQEGCDKSQVIKDFDDCSVIFFGDMMQPGGNDEPLATAISKRGNDNDGWICVKDWKHTWDILKDL